MGTYRKLDRFLASFIKWKTHSWPLLGVFVAFNPNYGMEQLQNTSSVANLTNRSWLGWSKSMITPPLRERLMLCWCHNGNNRKYFVNFLLEQLCHTDRWRSHLWFQSAWRWLRISRNHLPQNVFWPFERIKNFVQNSLRRVLCYSKIKHISYQTFLKGTFLV